MSTAALVQVQAPDEGDNVYYLEQVEVEPIVGEQETDEDGNPVEKQLREYEWAFGPIRMRGAIDLYDLTVTMIPSYAGIQVEELRGNMRDGLAARINFFVAKGEHKIYLKNGNELWTHIDLKITFNGSYNGDYKIMTFM